jgi:release factor glutamine methyltransferase
MTDLEYLKKYLPANQLDKGIKQLEKGIPVQYIVGNVDFYNTNILVNKDVLIPRFETELLVDKVINIAKKDFINDIKILDLCTGSGCIAIALNKNLKCHVDASDISVFALKMAQKNNTRNETSVSFIQSDMFDNISNKYDIIVSNPPYIGKQDYVMDIVKNNEPSIALFAQDDGLEFYKIILHEAKKHLNNHYLIALELGDHPNQVYELAKKEYAKANISLEEDLQGIKRYLLIME